MQFNKTLRVNRWRNKEEFKRSVLLALAARDNTPVDVVAAKFGEVTENVRQVLVCSTHVKCSFTCEIGHDEKQFDGYDNNGNRKEKTVTIWEPFHGEHRGDSCHAVLNENEQNGLDIDFVIKSINTSTLTPAYDAQVNQSALNLVKSRCQRDVERSISYPGNKHRNEKVSSTVEVEDLYCLEIPYSKVPFTYKNQEYSAEGFASGNIYITGNIPENEISLEDITKKQTEKLELVKNILWGVFAATCVLGFILYFTKIYWGWWLTIVPLIAATRSDFIYSLSFNSIIVKLRKENTKEKRDALEKSLIQHNFKSLTEKELGYFNETKEANVYKKNHGKNLPWWKSAICLFLVIVLAAICIPEQKELKKKQREAILYAPSNLSVSVISKTDELINNYKTEITFELKNDSSVAILSFQGEIILYDMGEKLGVWRFTIDKDVEAKSTTTATIILKGYTSEYEQLYSTTFQELGVEMTVNTITFATETGGSTQRNTDRETITLKESTK